jgi:hypothetical protein
MLFGNALRLEISRSGNTSPAVRKARKSCDE